MLTLSDVGSFISKDGFDNVNYHAKLAAEMF